MTSSFPDIVPSLPEGWPRFKNRLWRRRSCELVKSTSSCVRKAVSHLHQLQDLVDLCYKTESFDEDEKFSKHRSSGISGDGASQYTLKCHFLHVDLFLV